MDNSNHFSQSKTLKMILIGILVFALLIPLHFVKDLIYERAQRKKEVIMEISEKWGNNIHFYGPILKIPYRVKTETEYFDPISKNKMKEIKTDKEYAYFFPEKLQNQSNVHTQKLKRNNYEAVVFNSKMNFEGNYSYPDFSSKGIKQEDILWDQATIIIETSNLKSIKSEPKIKLGDQSYSMQANFNTSKKNKEALESHFINLKEWNSKATLPFQFQFDHNGSQQIKMIPIGKTTEVTMSSNWASPSFTGYSLPADDKEITKDGFKAKWKIMSINRPFPQEYFEKLPQLDTYSFGVDFIIPIDEYQQNERAAKYGFLVIGLTFLIFFLIQMISKINIHVFQYCMIGLALILFYTLLISITEHSSFSKAYLISSLAIVSMISLYSVSILKNYRFPGFIATTLGALYTFIFVIIQLENYALLVGSIGLFMILGAVMYFSRKIDWQSA